MNLKAGVAAAVVAVGIALTGCSQQPAVAVSAPTATSSPAAPEWSAAATSACRSFINAIPNQGAARALVKNAKKDPTLTELRQAEKDWADATSGMSTGAADLAVAAEPEVYEALSDVRDVVGKRPGDALYVALNVQAFGDAFTVCDKVTAAG